MRRHPRSRALARSSPGPCFQRAPPGRCPRPQGPAERRRSAQAAAWRGARSLEQLLQPPRAPLHLVPLEEIRNAILPVATHRLERADVEEPLQRVGLLRVAAIAGLPGKGVPPRLVDALLVPEHPGANLLRGAALELRRDHRRARAQGRFVVENELREARGAVQALVGRLRRGCEPQGSTVEDPLPKLPELTELLLVRAELG